MFSLLSKLRRPRRADTGDKAASGNAPPAVAVSDRLAAALADASDDHGEPERDLLQRARHALETRIKAGESGNR